MSPSTAKRERHLASPGGRGAWHRKAGEAPSTTKWEKRPPPLGRTGFRHHQAGETPGTATQLRLLTSREREKLVQQPNLQEDPKAQNHGII
ncbi:hypothetical protein TURU_109936 [Turdus rufiventris]|nr:hypothetical protein TURU_109936 [Turdus rufiventris]